jgi:hypothetical protein
MTYIRAAAREDSGGLCDEAARRAFRPDMRQTALPEPGKAGRAELE